MATAQTGSISRVVEDSNTGELLPGAIVIVVNTDLGAATGVDGQYSLEDVPVGTYTLRANFVGYRQIEQSVEVEDGTETDILRYSDSETIYRRPESPILTDPDGKKEQKLCIKYLISRIFRLKA